MKIRCLALLAGVLFVVSPQPAFAADDPYASRQWGLDRVRAEQAWSVGSGAGATIAVIDTGVDLKHPDLKGSFVAGRDFVADDSDPMDENGHGTHVAGIAAARANNQRGIAGVAPKSKIMPVRVLDARGRGRASDVEAGVRWAVDNGADVVNLSLADNVVIEGLTQGTMTEIVNYAWSKGAVPVIAAGNGGLFRTDSSRAKTLVVTATTKDDERAYYATAVGFAPWGIAAPGGDDTGGEAGMIFSTYWAKDKGSGYGWGMGTSMAAPHVAGAAAVLRGLGLDAQQTVDRLLATADDIGAPGRDFSFGNGLVNVAAAVKGLTQKEEQAKAASPSTSRAPVAGPSSAAPDPDVAASPRAAAAPAASGNGGNGGNGDDEVAEATDVPRPSPRGRVVASEEMSERSAIANLVVASTLLAAAGGLVGYGSLRRIRSRR